MQGHRRGGRELEFSGDDRARQFHPDPLRNARRGVACPTPVNGRDGVALRELCGRPAAMVTFLAGMWPRRIQPFHCAGVGAALAALHRAGASFGMTRANDLSVAGWRPLLRSCLDRASEVQPGLAAELEAE